MWTFPRLFYGWWIVLVSLITDGVKQGSFNRGFTVYILPIQSSLGLSAAAIGWADTLGRLIGGIQGPIMGYLTDKLGPGFMLAFGGITSGLGFILLSYTGNYFFFLLIFVGLMSVGFRSGYNNASIAAINNWFRRRRGLAMSLVSVGHGLGGAIAPVAGWMVLTFGWQVAVRISGVGDHPDRGAPVLPGQAVARVHGPAARRRHPGDGGGQGGGQWQWQ